MLDTLETKAAGGETLPAVPVSRTAGIAIMGSNPATVGLAPFGDPSWLIYSCSPDNTPHGNAPHAKALPRTDQVFELHLPLEDTSRPFAYLQYLTTLPLVWLRDQKALPQFKGGRLYPEKELRGTSEFQKVILKDDRGNQAHEVWETPNHDGMFDPCQFTSSIAYMLAKAIVDCEQQGIKQIGMWGILQQADNEYTYQRPGIQYFIHQAMQRGIKVIANRESRLFDMPQWKW